MNKLTDKILYILILKLTKMKYGITPSFEEEQKIGING